MTMMAHLTFEINPIAVRKEHSKRNDLADHYLAHGVEVTAALREVGNTRGVSFLAAMPNRIQMNA
jgi:hypothetical protein